jgi:hypothetical protein
MDNILFIITIVTFPPVTFILFLFVMPFITGMKYHYNMALKLYKELVFLKAQGFKRPLTHGDYSIHIGEDTIKYLTKQ